MTISAYEVIIRNEDRGTGSTKYFSNFHDAAYFYGKYKRIEGDKVVFKEIGGATISSE